MVTKTPCSHLEKLLSDTDTTGPRFENVYKYSGSNTDRRSNHEGRDWEKSLREKLEDSGLDPIPIKIIILRYEYDETFVNISKELKINNTETVVRIHNDSIKKLRSVWKK